MTIVVCMDIQGGVLFNKRRVSSDRLLIDDLLQLIAGQRICLRPNTAKLFPAEANLRITETCVDDVLQDEVLFLEEAVSDHLLNNADKLILYHWNRAYPSDVRFPKETLSDRWKLESSVDFSGNSHERITREVYVR